MVEATYVDFNSIEGEDGSVRFFGGHVAIELVDASVPLDCVKRITIQRKDALQLDAVAW